MLTVSTDNRKLPRRGFLRVGSLGLAGIALTDVLAAKANAGIQNLVRDKSVIFLFLHGGPSQTETFDPKMTAPAGVRSDTGEVQTVLPGVAFGGTFPKLAARADKFAVVRSFQTGDGNHDIKPIVGRDTSGANLGSLYARIAGTNHPVSGMPLNVALFPRSVDPSTQPENNNFGRFTSTGTIGAAYAPFVPGAGGNLQSDMTLQLAENRIVDRRGLLNQLDRIKRTLEAQQVSNSHQLRHQAFETILSGVANAFDLSQEDATVVNRYDTAPLVRPENISRKWNNYNNYVDNAKTLGKLLLLARRLCQAGCGFVTVTTNFVWDMHADVNNATIDEGMQYMGLPLDHALSTYIDDVHSLGLQDDILLVACGEMGRTPKINNRGGRDHWGGIAPLLIHGGGLRMGQVVGQSNRDVSRPATEPIRIDHLVATIMHSLLDVGQLRTMTGIPEEIMRAATAAQPIGELI